MGGERGGEGGVIVEEEYKTGKKEGEQVSKVVESGTERWTEGECQWVEPICIEQIPFVFSLFVR